MRYPVHITESTLLSIFLPDSFRLAETTVTDYLKYSISQHKPHSYTSTRYIKLTNVCSKAPPRLIISLLILRTPFKIIYLCYTLHDGTRIMGNCKHTISVNQDKTPITKSIGFYNLTFPYVQAGKSG